MKDTYVNDSIDWKHHACAAGTTIAQPKPKQSREIRGKRKTIYVNISCLHDLSHIVSINFASVGRSCKGTERKRLQGLQSPSDQQDELACWPLTVPL